MMKNCQKHKPTDIICKNKYGTYIVPQSHNRPVTKALKKGDVYEPKTIEFILKNYNNSSIITAGTYIGDFLPAFGNIPKVFAFEPVLENYIYAGLNKKINNLNNITLENLCLSNINQGQKMVTKINNVPCGGSSRILSNVRESSSNDDVIEEVNSIRLDDYLSKDEHSISIIQLDVEGHETQVIEGALKTIQKNMPIIIVETKPSKDVENKLFELGYEYHSEKLHSNHILFIREKHNLKF